MARCQDVEELVQTEVQASFPRTVCTVEWSDRSGNRALVVVAVDRGGDEPYLHQVSCLRERGSWFSWTEGKSPGWLAVEQPSGVATCVHPVEPGTTSVKLSSAVGADVVEVEGPRLFYALWDVTNDDAVWAWPSLTGVLVSGVWFEPVLPNTPVRATYLIDTYVRYEKEQAREDAWAWSALNDAAVAHPRQAWALVREALRKSPDDATLFAIAAGPLEELVVHHLDLLIDDIERAAIADPRLQLALSGVWNSTSDAALAARLAAVADAPGSAAAKRSPDQK